MKYFISIIVLLISCNSFAKQDIVALVNDKPITKYDFESRKRMAIALNKIDVSDPQVERKLDKDILNILIEEEILNQYAEKMGNKVSQEDINNSVTDIEKRNNMPPGHLMTYFKEIGVNPESFKQQIKGELVKYKIISSLSGSISVSSNEVDTAVVNSGYEGYDIDIWRFTSLKTGDKGMQEMKMIQNRFKSCSALNGRMYKEVADGERITGELSRLDQKSRSIVLDTKEGYMSSIYQEGDDKFGMILVCSKKPNSISDENMLEARKSLFNQKMSKKAAQFFKNLKARASIHIIDK